MEHTDLICIAHFFPSRQKTLSTLGHFFPCLILYLWCHLPFHPPTLVLLKPAVAACELASETGTSLFLPLMDVIFPAVALALARFVVRPPSPLFVLFISFLFVTAAAVVISLLYITQSR